MVAVVISTMQGIRVPLTNSPDRLCSATGSSSRPARRRITARHVDRQMPEMAGSRSRPMYRGLQDSSGDAGAAVVDLTVSLLMLEADRLKESAIAGSMSRLMLKTCSSVLLMVT